MKKSVFDKILGVSNLIVLIFSVIVAYLSLSLSLTSCGHILAITQLLVLLAFVPRQVRFRLPKAIGLVSLLIFLGAVCFQAIRNGQPNNGSIYSSKFSKAFFILNSIIAEEDGILLSAKLFPFIATARESLGFIPSLEMQYQRIRGEEDFFPTPLISTVLGLQSSLRFDTLAFHTPNSNRKKAVIFLHGSLGNWTLLCWLFSEPAREAGYDVVCPSTGLLGDWDSERGRAVLSLTIEQLKSQGYKNISLAGLSAGAVGAAALAKQYQSDLKRLILMFGNHSQSESVKLPTLVVYGAFDERFPASWMKTLAEKQKKNVPNLIVREIQGGHFALVKNTKAVQEEIRTWLNLSLRE